MEKFLEVLNKDERAQRMLTAFNRAAAAEGLQGEKLNEARKTFIAMMIMQNKAAFEQLSDEIYTELNK